MLRASARRCLRGYACLVGAPDSGGADPHHYLRRGDGMGWFFKKQNNEEDVENRLAFSRKLQAVTNKIHATNNLDEIMLDLSADICELFNCDRLTVYAVNKDKGFIYSKVKTGLDAKRELVLPITPQSVAGYVAATKKAIRIADAYDDAELKSHSPELAFCRVVDQLTGYRTRQMLAAPVVNARSRELLGVVQLLNNRDGGAFTESDEVGLEELCETMAIAYTQRMKASMAERQKYEHLVTAAVLSAPELELAMRAAQRKNIELEDVLVDEFQVKLAAIGESLSRAFNMPYESHNPDRRIPDELRRKLTRAEAERNQWLPLEQTRSVLTVLTTNPEQAGNAGEIHRLFPYATLLYRITTRREFRQTAGMFA
jgi:hypothetical protein